MSDLRELAARFERHGVGTQREAPLAGMTTLGTGGAAELLLTIESTAQLLEASRILHSVGGRPYVLGLGSNTVFPDEGLRGVVVRLTGAFLQFEVRREPDAQGRRLVAAGAAVALPKLSRATTQQGLLGLEAFSGFPATVGGAVRMNAGCYGSEIVEVLSKVHVIDHGRERLLAPPELGASYRETVVSERGWIVASAEFALREGDAEAARVRVKELNRRRWESLPSGVKNAGSVFRNPSGDHAGRLIEACDLKGCVVGDAQISPKHANVIINRGRATSQEIVELMAKVRREVRERFGVDLEPELVLAGSLWREFDRLSRFQGEDCVS